MESSKRTFDPVGYIRMSGLARCHRDNPVNDGDIRRLETGVQVEVAMQTRLPRGVLMPLDRIIRSDENIRRQQRPRRAARPRQHIWSRARSLARRAGIPFTIKPEDISLPTHCPVFGRPLLRRASLAQKDRAASIDKIVPEPGYVPGNIRVISLRANTP